MDLARPAASALRPAIFEFPFCRFFAARRFAAGSEAGSRDELVFRATVPFVRFVVPPTERFLGAVFARALPGGLRPVVGGPGLLPRFFARPPPSDGRRSSLCRPGPTDEVDDAGSRGRNVPFCGFVTRRGPRSCESAIRLLVFRLLTARGNARADNANSRFKTCR